MKYFNLVPDKKPSDLREEGIVLPALLWWLGVPLSLLVILYLLGVF